MIGVVVDVCRGNIAGRNGFIVVVVVPVVVVVAVAVVVVVIDDNVGLSQFAADVVNDLLNVIG